MIKADTPYAVSFSVKDHAIRSDYGAEGKDVFGEIFNREFMAADKATERTDQVRASDKVPVISDRSTESLRRDSTDDDANENEIIEKSGTEVESPADKEESVMVNKLEEEDQSDISIREGNISVDEASRPEAHYLLHLAAQKVPNLSFEQKIPSEFIIQQVVQADNTKVQQGFINDQVLLFGVNSEGEPASEKSADLAIKTNGVAGQKYEDSQKTKQHNQAETVKPNLADSSGTPVAKVIESTIDKKHGKTKLDVFGNTFVKLTKEEPDTRIPANRMENLQPTDKLAPNVSSTANVPERLAEFVHAVQGESSQGEQGRPDVQSGSVKNDNLSRIMTSIRLSEMTLAEQSATTQSRENVNRVVKAAQAVLSRGSSMIQIRLDPPELGHLRISIRQLQSGMQVQLQATNVRALQMIDQSSGELRAALEGQGIQATKIDVQLRSELRNDQSTSLGQNFGHSPNEENQEDGQQRFSDLFDGSEENQNDPEEHTYSFIENEDNEEPYELPNYNQKNVAPGRVDLKV